MSAPLPPGADQVGGARDPGLQPERTSLSWQRTALSTLVAAVVVARLTSAAIGPWGLLPLCLATPAWAWAVAHGRRRRSSSPTFAAPPTAALAGITTLLALTELAAVAHL